MTGLLTIGRQHRTSLLRRKISLYHNFVLCSLFCIFLFLHLKYFRMFLFASLKLCMNSYLISHSHLFSTEEQTLFNKGIKQSFAILKKRFSASKSPKDGRKMLQNLQRTGEKCFKIPKGREKNAFKSPKDGRKMLQNPQRTGS